MGDFEPKFKFTVSSGHDWFQIDADKKHGRMGIKAVATDEDGHSIVINTGGAVEMNETTMALAFGAPDAKPSPFGFGGKFTLSHITKVRCSRALLPLGLLGLPTPALVNTFESTAGQDTNICAAAGI